MPVGEEITSFPKEVWQGWYDYWIVHENKRYYRYLMIASIILSWRVPKPITLIADKNIYLWRSSGYLRTI